jgi:hypothetical protein
MLSPRIRSAALAVAGAAMIAISLMTSVAAAAPADSVPLAPAGDGVMARKPRIDLPLTDVVVTSMGFTADATVQNVEYKFRITNNGPDRIKFRYEKKAYWAASGQFNGYQDQAMVDVDKQPGELVDVTVNCHLMGDPSHYCAGAQVKITPLNGLDTNLGNNVVYQQSGVLNNKPD